jgi:hypothetical protein
MFDRAGQTTEHLSGILLGEMARVYDEHRNLEPHAIVAAYQAYSIYTLVLFFYVSEIHESLPAAMLNLQELASARYVFPSPSLQ